MPDNSRMDSERKECPRCGSPDPKLHPAVQFEGEVQLCRDSFHVPSAAEIEEREDELFRKQRA